MGEIRSYLDLDAWREARSLATMVYDLSRRFPKEETCGLSSQVRRAAISVVSNIAEGCGRGTSASSISFFFYARGSMYEMETQLMVACDLGYTTESQLNDILRRITMCKKLLNGLIRYYESKLPRK